MLSAKLCLNGGFWDWLNNLDFGTIGYLVVGLFITTWATSALIWKTKRIEARWTQMIDG